MATPTPEMRSRKRRRKVQSERMSTPYKRNASYADLGALPDNLKGEIIDGDLWASPRPLTTHAIAIREVTRQLGPAIADKGPGGWVILSDVEVRLGQHLLVPDIVGWRRERMPIVPTVSVVELSPDWVCEVLSPTTAARDRGRKREIYAIGRVAHLWYVDPLHKLIDILTLDGNSYRMTATVEHDDRGTFPPFESLEVDLAPLWEL